MEPNWTKCAEMMPPYNSDLIIAKRDGQEPYQVGTGTMLSDLFDYINRLNVPDAVDPTWRWTAYSDEIWRPLKPK